MPADDVALWRDGVWSVPDTFNGNVLAFESFDDGEGRGLFVGGNFTLVNDIPSNSIARFADPCGADLGLPRCTSLVNSAGLRGLLRADGSASVAQADVTLFARRLPADKATLFFFGTLPAAIPFGDGLRCVRGNQQRIFPAVQSDAQGEANLTLNFNAGYASQFASGNSLFFQGWFRDPMGGPNGFNTTDALEITFRP